MRTMVPVRDDSASHQGFRSPAYRVTGEYGNGIFQEMLGVRRRHSEALALARKHARRAHFREIVIR